MSDPRVEYVGPFHTTHVVIDGRRVPFLEAELHPGGRIELVLDGRYALDLDVGVAEHIVRFIADAIAVALGYASHPREGREATPLGPFHRMTELTSFESESA